MFITGLLTGLAIGMAFMFLWRMLMRAKRFVRWQEACDNQLLLTFRKTSHVETLLPYVPKWIQFPEFEQVDWLNIQLKELWPYINKAVHDTVFEILEGISKDVKSPLIAKLQLSHADLGSISPEIQGVRVSTWEKANQVVLDLDIWWQGNGKFELEIVTSTRIAIKPCISKIGFTGTLRVILELTDKVPVIAAYVYALNRKPGGDHYKVEKDISGSGLGVIPKLESMIDGFIESKVNEMMLWPKRQVGALIDGYDTRHLELQYSGEVIVTVLKGEGLKNVDTLGKSDPRVALYIDKKHQFVTPVVPNNLNPEWKDQVFQVPVDDALTATLYFRVEDEDSNIVSSYDTMGYATLPVADLIEKDKQTEYTLPLYNSLDSKQRNREKPGTLTVRVIYRAYRSPEERREATEAEKNWDPKKESSALSADEAQQAIADAEQEAKIRKEKVALMRGVFSAKDAVKKWKVGSEVSASTRTSVSSSSLLEAEESPALRKKSAVPTLAAAADDSVPAALSAQLADSTPSISRSTGVSSGSRRIVAEAVQEFEVEQRGTEGIAPSISIPAAPSSSGTSLLIDTASSKTVEEEGKHGTRHTMSKLIRGFKGGLRGSKEAGADFALESPGQDSAPKALTPGAATPKRPSLFGFKGKDKKAAEI